MKTANGFTNGWHAVASALRIVDPAPTPSAFNRKPKLFPTPDITTEEFDQAVDALGDKYTDTINKIDRTIEKLNSAA